MYAKMGKLQNRPFRIRILQAETLYLARPCHIPLLPRTGQVRVRNAMTATTHKLHPFGAEQFWRVEWIVRQVKTCAAVLDVLQARIYAG